MYTRYTSTAKDEDKGKKLKTERSNCEKQNTENEETKYSLACPQKYVNCRRNTINRVIVIYSLSNGH